MAFNDKIMKKIILIIAALTFGAAQLNAQDLSKAEMKERKAVSAEVDPAINQTIETDEEFIQVFNWLMETPIYEAEARRQVANASISNYIEENPNFNIELDIKLLKFADTSPELLTIFMGGYTEYIIENSINDPVEANIAGIEKVIEYYKKNEQYLEKDKNVEKFIRKAEKDKLDKFVERKSN